ncbi:MAG: YfcE family phosphodiesterase [Clostridia bacterium]|nr:YfcE family phosphodiesterase [Clostridia bacterium]
MSSIAVISDSHGSLRNLSLFRSRIGQPDALWHLGDCAEDAPLLAQRMNCGYVSVRGNCDPFSDAPLKQIIDWHHRRFLLLHGHTVSGRLNLLYLAKEQRCDAILFGHSHVPSAECVDGIWMINPGSLSRPRSSEGPSMALLKLDDAVFDVQLLFAK